jgi:hypothetical protein
MLVVDTGEDVIPQSLQLIAGRTAQEYKSKRQSFWSESVAVGDERFIQNIQQELSGRIPGRSIVSENGTTSLQEPQSSYSTLLGGKRAF